MRTLKFSNELQTNSEWFLAIITKVCPKISGDCTNYTCSWQQYAFCDNMQKLSGDALDLVYGDCEEQTNIAVPINESEPTPGIVLMRLRGTYDGENTIYEFVSLGGTPQTVLALTALQCSGGIQSATYSSGCFQE